MSDAIADHAHQAMKRFHQDGFKALGPKPEVLWKGGVRSQEQRFAQLIRLLPSRPRLRVLDVGCGFGDLLGYLQRQGRVIDYTGVDLCEEMVAESASRFPEATFLAGAFLELDFTTDDFDVVIASGVFNFSNPDWNAYVVSSMRKMLAVSRELAVANFLSSYSQQPSPDSHYANPAATLELLMLQVSPWAVLMHDYRWNDFTVSLRKSVRPQG